MKISVIGLGYIGLPTSVVFTKAGHQVQGFDVNKAAVDTLNRGKIHIKEQGLQSVFTEAFNLGFRAYSELQPADIYIISVPTPFVEDKADKTADLSFIDSAVDSIAPILKAGDLVVLESTSPPFTTKKMTDRLVLKSGLSRDSFYTAHCPERVLPGQIIYEIANNDRIIGAEREESALKAKALYETILESGQIYITNDVTAEMSKLVENSYRDVNIAFANELSILCDKMGIDVHELISLANKHPRVNILSPGVGVGGHCIAVDPWFIVEAFRDDAKLIHTARDVNDSKPLFVADKIEKALNHDTSKTVGILGLAFKANIDDCRQSPSITLAHTLINRGYNVIGCEPNVVTDSIEGIKTDVLDAVLRNSDIVVLAQNHREFLDRLEEIMHKPNIRL